MRRLSPAALVPPAVLLVVLVGLCGPVLFARPTLVLSHVSTDLAHHFYHVRTFAVERLRAGELPFWNPHIFAGMPFVGGFQSALFYPGTLLFLALPMNVALDVTIVLHLFLVGAFTMLAAARRGAGAGAAFVAGTIVALGGPLFPHVWGGHLTLLCAAPWAILGLASVDALLAGAGVAWVAVAAASAALAVLAGHPQTAFHAGVAALIWAAVRWPGVRERAKVATTLIAATALGVAMAAVQLWPAWREAPWGIRTALPRDVAATFSLPPENLLTLLAPLFFGGSHDPYWGRGYFWEMSLFVGVATLPLATLGAFRPGGDGRRLAVTALLLLLLALGANTPLFALLYAFVPGFDHIRGWCKFSFPFAFFVAMLAAEGIERLRTLRPAAGSIVATAALGLVVLGVGLVGLRSSGGEPPAAFADLVGRVQAAAAARGETWLPDGVAEDPAFLADAAARASRQLLGAGAVLGLSAVLLGIGRTRPGSAAKAFVVLVGAELALAAGPLVVGFDPSPLRFETLRTYLASRPPGSRIVNAVMPNSAMSIGAREIGGYDPGVPRRTAEFLAFSQERPPDAFSQYPKIESIPEIFSLLRFDLAVFLEEGRLSAQAATVPPLPRLVLAERCEVIPERDDLFARLAAPDLDYRTTVLLETPPEPSPQPGGAGGRAAVVSERNGELVLEAAVPAPALLVVTDAYHPGWVAEALPGSAQDRYEILPAYRMLQAIPLGIGEHRIRLIYRVPGFYAAAVLTVVGWCAAGLLAFLHRPRVGPED